MAEYKPYLDEFFEDAESLFWKLSEKDDYFTNYAFIRKSSQKHQKAYIELLKAVLDHRGETFAFNIAHENIGSRLSRLAQAAGYEQEKKSEESEINVFGDPTSYVIYRRTNRVVAPKR